MANELTLRVARALMDADAERALSRALHLAAEAGLTPEGAAGDEPWLTVQVGPRSCKFYGSPTQDHADQREHLEALFAAALQRLADNSELKRAQERLSLLSSASFEGILIHVDGNVIDVNQRLCEMAGYEAHELLGPNTMSLVIAPEDLASVYARLAQRYEGQYVITGVRKDGSRFRAELSSKQGTLGERPVRIAAVRDVTQAERTASLLRESEARFRELARRAFDLVVTSEKGTIIDVAGATDRVLGYRRQDMIGHSMLDFISPPFHQVAIQVLAETRLDTYELEALGSMGQAIPLQVTPVLATFDGRPVRVAGLRDLRPARKQEAERLHIQRHMERGQRLESLGVLAGGIAHDFNNLLVGVIGNAEVLLMGSRSAEDRLVLEAIVKAGLKGAELTRQMLAYAGQGVRRQTEPVDLGVLCREIHALLGTTISKKAKVDFDTAPESVVIGDRVTLTQVVMNLLTNASDALEGRSGQITVRTRRLEDPGDRWHHALGTTVTVGQWVLLEVDDDGCGMDAATQERAFEPFFSTKTNGHGLGLAACLGIVKAHEGALRVHSEPGRGSRFSLLFPRGLGSSLPSPTSTAMVQKAFAGRRVLVVDDEPIVRQHLRRALERFGYVVVDAAGGNAALASVHDVDVVILDMTMPGMDGAEVARRMRAMGVTVPIVLSSGYATGDTENEFDGLFQAFLPKPYKLDELMATLKQALKLSA